MININIKELSKVIKADEYQMSCLMDLARHRAKDSRTDKINDWYDIEGLANLYADNGIFYLAKNQGLSEASLEDLEILSEDMGLEYEEWGVNQKNEYSFQDGFIIPVPDMNNNVLFYINNNFMRAKEMKYINIYTDKFKSKEKELKIYGMSTAKKGLKQDKMVYIEGVFDKITLESYGVPCSAFLGTSMTKYAKQYVKRFSKKIYVGDSDIEGENAWKRFNKEYPEAVRYPLPLGVKDVDEFEKQDKKKFSRWLEGLKAL